MKIKDKAIDEYTMEMGRAHFYIFLMIIPVLLISLLPFILIWGNQAAKSGWEPFYNHFIPVILTGIFFHELLHGIGWSFFVPKGMKSIKFGINWKFLAPYCHCKVPLKVRHYKIGGAMPLLILGIFPVIFALLFGNAAVLFFGILFIWGAGGDIIVLFMLQKLDNDSYIYDHPDKMGFYRKIGTP